ncbi:MAG: cation:proton antiporter [Parcubacteria group bacterium]
MKKNARNYLVAALGISAVWSVSNFGGRIYQALEHNHEHGMLVAFFVLAALFMLSFVVFYLSHLVKLPSFILAIFLGLAAKPLLTPILGNDELLGVIVSFGATLILFAGGLETPFANFKKLIWKIFSVSFAGLFITAFLFSWTIWLLSVIFGLEISVLAAVLLGALLASTDPAAIIPVLKRLRFHNRSIKDIIISESAVTDVVGTLLTVVFLALAVGGNFSGGINQWYQSIFSYGSMAVLATQLFFGTLLGLAGYFFLELLLRAKHLYGEEFEADAAFFISVPVIIFTGAIFFGGSGYLAAFVAGLIFHITEHLSETERFFNNLVDGFLKPIIFVLLGALVDPAQLLTYAPIGIVAALIFMFIIRPVAVFVSLGGFHFFGQEKLSWRDLLFISFVRETGAIPAVLMVTIISLGLAGMEGLVEIGMWTILLTLIIEPLLTPFVAKYLQVAEEMQDRSKAPLNKKSTIVLVTRGESFLDRMPYVVKWASKHSISDVAVMLCLENKYTATLEKDIKAKAQAAFAREAGELKIKSLSHIDFTFISRKGSLHENIDTLAKTDNKVVAIFVGKKMLDYRLSEIKQLAVPFYFMD